MALKLGLWIDHRRALIVTLKDKKTQMRVVESEVDKRVPEDTGRRSGFLTGHRDLPSDDIYKRDLARHIDRYYDEVANEIKQADQIFVMGPGEAKVEFIKRLQKRRIASKVAEVQAAEKMTDRQVMAKVLNYFEKRPAYARA